MQFSSLKSGQPPAVSFQAGCRSTTLKNAATPFAERLRPQPYCK